MRDHYRRDRLTTRAHTIRRFDEPYSACMADNRTTCNHHHHHSYIWRALILQHRADEQRAWRCCTCDMDRCTSNDDDFSARVEACASTMAHASSPCLYAVSAAELGGISATSRPSSADASCEPRRLGGREIHARSAIHVAAPE